MKIDIFTHISPVKYREAFLRVVPSPEIHRSLEGNKFLPALWDMDYRSKMISEYEDVVQVLTTSLPPPDIIPDPKDAAEVAKIANDEMAEIVASRPHQFVAGVATLALTDIDAALEETDRAINDLGLKGVLI